MDSVLFLLRRRYVVLLVLLFGALLCAACGARNAPMARADAAPTASPTTAATLTPTAQPTPTQAPTETPLPTPHEDAAGANVEIGSYLFEASVRAGGSVVVAGSRWQVSGVIATAW